MPDRQGKRVTDHRSDVLKGSIPRVFLAILGTRKTRMFEAERREREGENSRDEATQRGMEELYQRQCGSR